MKNFFKFFWPDSKPDRFLLGFAVLGFGASVYLLFFYRFQSGPQDMPKVGVLKTQKSVRRRHTRTLQWDDIYQEGIIYLRDTVYTPPKTNATVTLKGGKILTLEPDSMVQFDEFLIDGIQISLFDFGLFRLLPFPKPKQLDLLPDPRPLELLHAELTDRLRAFLGVPPGRHPLGNLNAVPPLDNCLDFGMQVVSPINEKYNLKANRWINMIWTPIPVPNIDYELHVSRRSDFKQAIAHKTKATRLIVQFDDEGTYFWRVVAKCPTGNAVSETNKFTLSIKSGQQKVFLAEVSKDSEFSWIVRAKVEIRPQCSKADLPPGKYYCRVRAVNGDSEVRIYDFTIH